MEIKTFKGYSDADFTVRLESASSDAIYIHCEVVNWKASVLKRMYGVFAKIADESRIVGFKEIRTISPNPKFASLFAFKTIDHIEYGGKKYEVMSWDLSSS